MNKLGLYLIGALLCYFTYLVTDTAKEYHDSKGRQDFDKIIKVESKDISECSIATDQDVVFYPQDLEMYTNMQQGCSYKIWTSGSKINSIEHVNDGCQAYLPDSLHKF